MKTYYYTICLIGLAFASTLRAEPIEVGSKIEEVTTRMKDMGYRQESLSMVHIDVIRDFIGLPEKKKEDLEDSRGWRLDEGHLAISYVVSTGSVTGLTFILCDERPKAERKTFQIRVVSFDPKTGILVLATKQKKEKLDMATPNKPSD